MATIVATEQLTFDDFKKDEYRAFKVEGQPDCISLPTMLDRLKDMLMRLERQMEAGDHLHITLSVRRPSENPIEDGAQRIANNMLKAYGAAYNPFSLSHP